MHVSVILCLTVQVVFVVVACLLMALQLRRTYQGKVAGKFQKKASAYVLHLLAVFLFSNVIMTICLFFNGSLTIAEAVNTQGVGFLGSSVYTLCYYSFKVVNSTKGSKLHRLEKHTRILFIMGVVYWHTAMLSMAVWSFFDSGIEFEIIRAFVWMVELSEISGAIIYTYISFAKTLRANAAQVTNSNQKEDFLHRVEVALQKSKSVSQKIVALCILTVLLQVVTLIQYAITGVDTLSYPVYNVDEPAVGMYWINAYATNLGFFAMLSWAWVPPVEATTGSTTPVVKSSTVVPLHTITTTVPSDDEP